MNITNMQMGLKVFAEQKPHEVAITSYGQSLTFQDLYHRVNALTNSLVALGVQKGDHIAVYMRNRLEMPEIYYAISAVGAVCLPVNYMLVGDSLTNLLNASDVKYVFVEEDQLSQIEAIQDRLTYISSQTIIVVGSTSETPVNHYESMLQQSSIEDPTILVDPDATFNILFTSGTTSLPKGIVFDGDTVFKRTQSFGNEWKMDSSTVTLISVPIYHSVGLTFTWFLPLFGCKLVIMREFDPILTLQWIQDHQITHAFFVPTQYHHLLQVPNIRHYQLSSLQLLIAAAAPLSAEKKKQITEKFNCRLTEFFGSSETSAYIILRPEDVIDKAASIGKKIDETVVEIRLIDAQGNDVSPGEDGEFAIRSPYLFSEYYKAPQETQDSHLPGGWYCTGDMGKIDSDGFYYLLDRKKDMLISGGVNIYPKDIEEVVQLHPAVQEVAVIGIPDELWGEAVKAYIVLKEGQSCSEEEMIHDSNKKLAKFQRIKEVDFIQALPRNPSGKILKRELRKN
ncbi:AMP-binding protein [Sporosarcina sp. FSL K6-1522]|uniref:class I adenylate-forming enzyme family protein n=1 Tax=Sporosarcina sp. FSL K6-1522 TaxID=2921554 RepID=UPI00315A8E01